MKSWLSKVFTSEKDSFIEYLFKDKTLFDDIKTCVNSCDSITKNIQFQKFVVKTSDKFIKQVGDYKLVKMKKESDETELLEDFINSLFLTFAISPSNSQDSVSIIHSLSLIYKFTESNRQIPLISNILVNICEMLLYFPFISDTIDTVMDYVLKNKSYVESLRNQNFLKKLFDDIVINKKYSIPLQTLSMKLRTNYHNYDFQENIDFQNSYNDFLQKLKTNAIPQENIGSACTIFPIFLNITNHGNNLDNREILQLIHDKLIEMPDAHSLLPNTLYLFSITPAKKINKTTLMFLYDHIIRIPISSLSVLSMFKTFEFLINSLNGDVTKLEKAYPINTIFQPPQKLVNSEVAEAILTISQLLIQNNFDRLVFCLKSIFNILSSYDLELNHTIYRLLNETINSQKITLSDFNDNNFLQIFLNKPTLFIKYIKEDQNFVELVINTYCTVQDDDIQWLVMKLLMQSEMNFEHTTKYSQFCSRFISLIPSQQIIMHVMAFISEHSKESLVNILISAFCDNSQVCDIFIQNAGMQWISNLMLTTDLPPILFSVLISSLMHHKVYDEINDWIKSLPLDHPLFSMDEALLFNIVFGGTASQTNMRVPALLPLIKIQGPMVLSPYAVYSTSKSALSEFIRHGVNIDDNSVVTDIANRYISSSQFLYLLKNSQKVSSFCSLTCDSFPLFEFTNSSRSAAFKTSLKFSSVTFWVKFVDDKSSQIRVLTTNICHVIWQSGMIYLCYGKTRFSLKCDVGKWVLIRLASDNEISLTSSLDSKSVSVKINEMEFNYLQFGSFDELNPAKWYIGPAIRISSKILNISEIFEAGVGNFNQFDDELIIHPSSKIANRGDGLLSVPYCGFAWYMHIYIAEVFSEIMSAKTSKRIEELISSIIYSNIIFPSIKGIWTLIKTVMKEKSDLISNAFLLQLFQLIVTIDDKNDFQVIMNDPDIWFSFNELLLPSLLYNIQANQMKFIIKCSNLASILSTMYRVCSNKMIFVEYLLKFTLEFQDSVFLTHLYNLILDAENNQVEIIKFINSFLQNTKIPMIADVITFDDICELMAVSKGELSLHLLKFIAYVSAMKNDYITDSTNLALCLLHNLKDASLWTTLLYIATGQHPNEKHEVTINSFTDSSLVNYNIIPLIITLICYSCITLIIIYNDSNMNEDSKIFENHVMEMISVVYNFSRYDLEAFSTPELLNIFLFFTPLIFDSTKLFSPNTLQEIANIENNVEYPELNLRKTFQSWSFPNEYYSEWSKTNIKTQPIFGLSFISFLTPIITYYAPNVKFPFEEFTEFPRFLIARVSEITTFFNMFLTASIKDPQIFKSLLELIVFKAPLKDLKGYREFGSKLIGNFIIKREVYFAPIESLQFLFSSISVELNSRSFGNESYTIITSSITSLNALSNVIKPQEFSTLVLPLRHIIAVTFDVCKFDEIENLLTIFSAMSNFLFSNKVFDEFKFNSCMLVKFLNFFKDRNGTVKNFFEVFMSKIILNDSYINQFTNGAEEKTNLMAFIKGINILVENGQKSYFEWFKENQIVYISVIQKLEDISNSFITDNSYHPENLDENDDDVNFSKTLMSISNNFHSLLLRSKSKISHIKNAISFLQDCEMNFMLRFTEDDATRFFWKIQSSLMKSVYKPKSFRLSQIKQPILSSRIMYPSLYELSREENKNDKEYKPRCNLNLINCYPKEYTFIESLIENMQLPLIYSGQTVDLAMLNMTNFINIFEKQENPLLCKFNANLLRHTTTFPVVVFQFKASIAILIGAQISNNKELELIKETQNQLLYKLLISNVIDGMLGQFSLFAGHVVLIIPIDTIIFSTKHLVNHKPLGILFSTLYTGDIILTSNVSFPQIFQNIFTTPQFNPNVLHTIPLHEATTLWANNKITNYEYLSILNIFGGRSTTDLAQYPVFPWVISDYESSDYPHTMRPLDTVMGQLTEARAKIFDVSYETQNYFYGAHYSMSASVHYFLFRVPPYLFFEWDLHCGWDNKDRMFFDMQRAWNSSSKENTNDIKELLPEFFSLPEFLFDSNKLDVENVVLPPWAKNAAHFIIVNRDELENGKIEDWIDLIFGYSQTGQAAIQAHNVFMPILYHNYVMTEDDDIETIALQLDNWGQCPIQLFKKKHIQKNQIQNQTETTKVTLSPFAYNPLISYIDDDILFKVDTNSLAITNGQIIIVFDKMLAFAKSIDVSFSCNFAVVDFSNGLSRVYKLTPGFGNEPFQTFPHNKNAFTRINSVDLICATVVDNKSIEIWDFVRCSLIRTIEYEERVFDICFDEYEELLYVLFSSLLICMTVNGVFVFKEENINHARCICMPRILNTCRNRSIFIGFGTGHVREYKLQKSTLELSFVSDFEISDHPIKTLSPIVGGAIVVDTENECFCIRKKTMQTEA